MKGLILAGGSGSRLRPLTYTGAKQLVPIANRPVLFYAIENLVQANVTDIGVIVSPETGEEIRAALGDGSGFGARLTFVPQDKPKGLAHAVKTARPFLLDHPFVMYLGDNVIGMQIKNAVHTFMASDCDATIFLKEVSNPSAFGIAKVVGERVVRVSEKPSNPESNLAVIGIYLFRPGIHDAIEMIAPSPRGELEIADAISVLIDTGGRVHHQLITSWWLDTGKKDDVLLANDTVLDDRAIVENFGSVDSQSKIEGRVQIGEGARVRASVVRGPAVIGQGAVIWNSYVGPFTSIGDRVKITDCAIEHCVVMEDSRISVPSIRDSLIGKRVIVAKGQARTGRSLVLMVGDDCVVENQS